MRLMQFAAAALLLSIAPLTPVLTPAQAGFLDLAVDEVSRTRNCSTEPCIRNDLSYRTRFMRGRYLRYKAYRTPPQYTYVPEQIVVKPPRVAAYGEPTQYQYVDGNSLLVATDKRTRTYSKPVYEQVDRQVLVARAKYHVVRAQPTSAWYATTVVVRGPCIPGTYGCGGLIQDHDTGGDHHKAEAD